MVSEVKMETEWIIVSDNSRGELVDWRNAAGIRKPMMVCDESIRFLGSVNERLEELEKAGTQVSCFQDFQANPLYENVVEGVHRFRSEGCDSLIAVGGGSAMDVAKCIKLFQDCPGDGENGSWLKTEYVENQIPFLAIPTTAGTGSEATRFAVIYYGGEKQSVTSESIIPDTVLMDPDTLLTLPLYQKKATMCDALCHAIESYWSINSTEESKAYSREAIQLIMANMDGYLENTEQGRREMLHAANVAGKAINITQTTAGHAMCYKITSLFGCAHGHAAILCNRVLYAWMMENADRCTDARGEAYLRRTLDEIGMAMGCANGMEGAARLNQIFELLGLEVPSATESQYEKLKTSVNPVRLKNHPVRLDEETLDELYHRILREN